MRKSIVLACTSVLSLAIATAASAAEPPSKEEALARELLEVTGLTETSKRMMRQMVESAAGTDPAISPELSEAILAEMDMEALLEQIVPVYVQHFTADEMSAAIAFYRTPAGQSMLQKLPLVMVDAIQLTRQWATEASERALARMEAEREGVAPTP